MDKDLVEYFIAQTDLKFVRVEKKLEELTAFKWKVLGGVAVISAIVHLSIALLLKG